MPPAGYGQNRKFNKVENQNLNNTRRQLLRDVFFSPKSAFESYYQQTELSGKDIFLIHLSLALLGGLMKFFGNLIQIFLFKVTSFDEETNVSLFQGVYSVFIFYLFCFLILRLLDSFRHHHQMRDKSKDWDGPEPHVFILSFLPYSSTAVFWILPPPLPLLTLLLGFLYSLQLSYMFLSLMRGWSSREFFFFFMKAFLFFMTLISIPLFVYNLVRTAFF